MLFSNVKSEVIRCNEDSFGLRIIYPHGAKREIVNITNDESRMTALSDLINSHDVSELHVDDIIEDFLQ